jgi:2-polyprenyl-3-methyl-5-hydroxy-6-metoxy-1,4-benzoquinol methylase
MISASVDPVIERACSLCGSRAGRAKFAAAPAIVTCEDCGFVYLRSYSKTALDALYREDYFQGRIRNELMVNVAGWDYFDPEHLAEVRARSEQILAYLERFVTPGNILDVGCGPGLFLERALARGWTPSGFDVSDYAVAYAGGVLGLPGIRKMDAAHMDFASESFDAVTLFHVIEHVAEPKALLAACHKTLRRDGVLLVETPDISTRRARKAGADWKYLRTPEHLSYFTEKTLLGLLEALGFKPVGVKRATDSTGALMALCGGKEAARTFYERGSRWLGFRLLVHWIRSFKAAVSGKVLKDFDNITIVARRV